METLNFKQHSNSLESVSRKRPGVFTFGEKISEVVSMQHFRLFSCLRYNTSGYLQHINLLTQNDNNTDQKNYR